MTAAQTSATDFEVPGLEVTDHTQEWPMWPTPEQVRHFVASSAVATALRNLVDEKQPLGIDRPAYQAALCALDQWDGA